MGDSVEAVGEVGRVEHITLEHRVLAHAPERESVVGEDVSVVLRMVADFRGLLALDERAEKPERLLPAEFGWRAFAVGERDIAGFTRPGCKGESDEPGVEVIERGGLGVESEKRGAGKPCGPVLDLRARAEDVDGGWGRWPLGLFLPVRVCTVRSESCVPEWTHTDAEALAQGGETWDVRRSGGEILRPGRQRHIAAQPDEFAVALEPIAFGHHEIGEPRAKLRGPRDERLEAPVPRQPAGGGLGADPAQARDVVGAVADQGEIVDDLCRIDTVAGPDLRRADTLVAHRIEERDSVVDQLRQILVVGDDEDVAAPACGGGGEGGEDVVGLDTADAQKRPTQSFDQLERRGDLADEILGHGLTLRLIVGEGLVAEGWPSGVEDDGEAGVGMVPSQAFEDTHESEDGLGGFAPAVAQRRKGVELAVKNRRPIDENERAVHRRARTCAGRSAVDGCGTGVGWGWGFGGGR